MGISYDHAKRLVLLSAEIMEREPEKHGYEGGETVEPVRVIRPPGRRRRVCFCLMGGAAVLLLAERGETYTVKECRVFGVALQRAWSDIYLALPEWGDLVEAHDTTRDAATMAAKVRAIFAQHEGK